MNPLFLQLKEMTYRALSQLVQKVCGVGLSFLDELDKIAIQKTAIRALTRFLASKTAPQAAKVMKMSYKGVWSKIKATEKHLNQKIVHADRQEGTRLTRQGKELLEQYKQLEKKSGLYTFPFTAKCTLPAAGKVKTKKCCS